MALFKTGAKSPSVAELRKRLADVEAEIARSESEHAELAYGAECGDTAAAAKIATLQDAMAAGHRRVAALRAAVQTAQQAEAQKVARAKTEARASLVASIKKRLHEREGAAVRIMAAVENLSNAFVEFQEHTEKLRTALPAGTLLRGECMTEFGGLHRAVGTELFRKGHGRRTGNGTSFGYKLPGASPEDLRHSSDPDAIEPLDARVKSASRYIIGVLDGSIVPPQNAKAPALAAPQAKVAKPAAPLDIDAVLAIEAETLAGGQTFDARTVAAPAPIKMG